MQCTLLDPGTYEMRVIKAIVTTTKATGQALIRVTLRSVLGHQCHHTDVVTNFVVIPDNPYAMTYFRKHIEAFGAKFSPRSSLSEIANDLVDRVALVQVSRHDYQGIAYNEVKHVWSCRRQPCMTRRELNLMDTA